MTKTTFAGSINGTQYDNLESFLKDLHAVDRSNPIEVTFSVGSDLRNLLKGTQEREETKRPLRPSERFNFNVLEPEFDLAELKNEDNFAPSLRTLNNLLADGEKFLKEKWDRITNGRIKESLREYLSDRIHASESNLKDAYKEIEENNRQSIEVNKEIASITAQINQLKRTLRNREWTRSELNKRALFLNRIKAVLIRVDAYWKRLKEFTDMNN